VFQHQNIWLPDGEAHFPEWMTRNGEIVDGRGTYQYKKWLACLPWIKQWRTAVDVGAHVGFWSGYMDKRFAWIEAFEPVPEFRDCFRRNLRSLEIVLHECALGAAPGRVSMVTPPLDGGIDSGGTHVGGEGEIEMRTLDSFNLQNVDFIKIDCEGFEHHVLEGARETLERCKPCVIVEQKPHKLGPNFGIKGTPAVDYLRSLGAHLRTVMSGDFIMAWDA
jgi:FkbM family methyltransferase